MKILISGATGFIGKHLVSQLLQQNNAVYAIVRPTTDISHLPKTVKIFVFDAKTEDLISFMRKEKFDGVIHLASLFLAQHKPDDIERLISSNLFFGTALIESASLAQIPWFINTGTFWQHYKNKKYSPVNLYAATKQAFEDILKYYVETSSTNIVTIKLCDTFGPHDTRTKIFSLFMKISESGENLLMSPGKQKIDINYVDNIISGYMRVVTLLSKDNKKVHNGKTYAISSSTILSLQKLAELFEKVSGKKLNITWGGRAYRDREVMTPWTKGEKIPGWRPPVTLREGIKKVIK